MSTSSIFSDVKERLNLREVAEYYGLEVNRGGFVSCPFHDERTPSMKLYDDHFYCYGCGCHGDVTDLTAKIFNLSPIDAARKLASDFGIISDERTSGRKPTIKEKMMYYSFAAREEHAYKILRDYCDFLDECRKEYAPARIDDELHPLFVKAITELPKFEYYRDVFIFGTKDERKEFIAEFAGVLGGIERELNGMKARPEMELV
ncbi:MAG: hypothetical protein LBR54_01000 [Oscillospiraceae bacterium]|jgi:hypothetical protein|nr:hypothetical protein [Oscillospiraceae bacterium]